MEERTANYPGYRDESTMKIIRHESLGIYIYSKPKNQRERDYNDNMTEKAEEKNTKWENVYKYFERFCEGKCTFGEITVDFCVKFMEYLQTTPQIHRVDKKLHINTAAGYWSTFRAVLHTAYQNTLCK